MASPPPFVNPILFGIEQGETGPIVEVPATPKPGTSTGNPIGDAIQAALQTFLDVLSATIANAAQGAGGVIGSTLATLNGATSAIGKLLQDLLRAAGLGEVASQISTSGDLFQLLGSIQEAIVDRARLTAGPLSFDEVLAYADRIEGIQAAVILMSFVFSLAVEVVSLGQVEGFVGLLIHMIDEVVGQQARVVKTALVKRAVGDPLIEGYKLIHRTGRLSTSELEAGYALGLVEDDELVAGLAADGFNDRAIELKGALAAVNRFRTAGVEPVRRHHLGISTQTQLLKASLIDDETFVRRLVDLGVPNDEIQELLELTYLKIPPPPPVPP